jgi:UDP-glucose 4-epimerase
MKILISGANGRLGGHLVAKLIKDHQLVLASRGQEKVQGAATYDIDLSDPTCLNGIIETEKPEAIIHLAALLGPVCEANPELAQTVNVDATRQVAAAARDNGVRRLVFASSAAVYNQTELKPTKENENIDPQSNYGKTKLAAENALLETLSGTGTSLIILRPFNIYGSGFSESLVQRLVDSVRGEPVKLRGPDNFYRDYIHFDDVIQAVCLCLEAKIDGPLKLNIASGQATSNAALVEALRRKGLDVRFEAEVGPTDISWADVSAAKSALGFTAQAEIRLD